MGMCVCVVCMCAGRDGNVDAVRSWVASGANINVEDHFRDTPLMFASEYLHAECVAEMLRLGADARRVNNDGWTALHKVAVYADRRGDGGGVVRLLIAAECDAAVRHNDSHTAVELARTRGVGWATKFEGWIAAAMA